MSSLCFIHRVTIEKVFNQSLIPFNMANQSERMQRLYTVYMELEMGQDAKDSHQATYGFHTMLLAHRQYDFSFIVIVSNSCLDCYNTVVYSLTAFRMASLLRESLETNSKLVGDQQANPVLKDNFSRSLMNLARKKLNFKICYYHYNMYM